MEIIYLLRKLLENFKKKVLKQTLRLTFRISGLLHKEPCYKIRGSIWHYFHNLKNVKNTDGGELLLVKSSALA